VKSLSKLAPLIVIGGMILLVIWLANQAPKEQISAQKSKNNISVEKPVTPKVYTPDVPVVNLPAGQEYMYIINASPFELPNGMWYTGTLYVTRSRGLGGHGADVHKITFWKPGGSQGTWEPVLIIQEN